MEKLPYADKANFWPMQYGASSLMRPPRQDILSGRFWEIWL